jgi:hypothetical protein
VYGNYLVNTEGIRFFGDGHKIFANHLRGQLAGHPDRQRRRRGRRRAPS